MTDTTADMRTLLRPSEWLAGHRAALGILIDLDPAPDERLLAPEHDATGASDLVELLEDFDVTPTVLAGSNAPYTVNFPSSASIDPALRLDSDTADPSNALVNAAERFGGEARGVVLGHSDAAGSIPAGVAWIAEPRPAPFPTRSSSGEIAIPTSRLWCDRNWLDADPPAPPSAMLESWSLSLQSVRTQEALMVVCLTARMAGHPGTVETIRRFLDEAVGAGDVWITNATAIAKHVSDIASQE